MSPPLELLSTAWPAAASSGTVVRPAAFKSRSENVEDLIKQPCPVRLGFGAVDEPLGQLVAGSGIRASQCLVEKLHELVDSTSARCSA